MISVNSNMFNDGQPILIRECEFTAAQLEDIINRSAIDDKLKPDKCVDGTSNIVVNKLDNQVSSSLLQQALLNGKEKDASDKLVANEASVTTTSLDDAKLDCEDQPFLSLVVMRKKKPTKREDDAVRISCLSPSKDIKPTQSTIAQCTMCGKKFSSNYNVKRHMTSCKLCPDYERSPRFHCQCGRSYSQEWDMKKHKMSCKDTGKKCKKCLDPTCNLLFYHRSQLVAHMKTAHDVNIQDPEVHEFESLDEFRLWKEKEEEETYTYYSKQTGANVTGVSVNTYYVCQHDGSDRSHTSNPRKTERRNKKGRVKTGRLCWSQMNVKEFWDGTVRVTYYPSHTHTITAADTEHHPLPTSIHSEIKRRLSEIKADITDDMTLEDFNDFKKPRKRSYGMNLRTLRSLARKNRKLFRITAEALDDADEGKVTEMKDAESEETNKMITNDTPVVLMQPNITAQEIDQEDITKEAISCCTSHLEHLKSFIDSGKLSGNFLAQIESTLRDLTHSCQEEILRTEENPASSLCELSDVMYQSETVPSTSFPLVRDSLELETMEKTVYQVVTLEPKEEPASPQSQDLLYQNSMELVGPREFIIIANDQQIFVNQA